MEFYGFDEAPDYVGAYDVEGICVYASRFGAQTLLGCEPSELVGASASERFHPDDVARIMQSHVNSVDGIDAHTRVTYRIRRGDGAYRWVETTSRTMPVGSEHQRLIWTVTRSAAPQLPPSPAVDGDLLDEFGTAIATDAGGA